MNIGKCPPLQLKLAERYTGNVCMWLWTLIFLPQLQPSTISTFPYKAWCSVLASWRPARSKRDTRVGMPSVTYPAELMHLGARCISFSSQCYLLQALSCLSVAGVLPSACFSSWEYLMLSRNQ